jgi:outer membrane protein TolC
MKPPSHKHPLIYIYVALIHIALLMSSSYVGASPFSMGATPFTEESLISQLLETGLAPLQAQIDSLQAEETEGSIRRLYSPNLEAQSFYLNSKKDAANSFQPTLDTSRSYSIGVSKAWDFGARTKIGFEESYSRLRFNSSKISSHSPFLFAEAHVSLFENLLGRMDKAALEQALLGKKMLSYQKDLSLHQSIVRARSLYWSLIANHLSVNISKGLLKTSEQQLEELRKRQKSGIAERSDVLLSQAQVSQRKSALMGLQIKQEGLLRATQQLIPGFKIPREEDYPEFSVSSFIGEINACIGLIQAAGNKTPLEYSTYADLLPLVDQLSQAEQKTSTQGLGADLNFTLRAESNGVDSGFPNAFKESASFEKNTWSAGIRLSIPLDKSDYRLKSIKTKKSELSRHKQNIEIRAMLDATHSSAIQSIGYLMKTIENLETSTGFLKERIKSVEQKYRQGRVDFLNLVQEQDQLFNAENGLIESQLMFMNELLNYFSAFDKLPCKLNLAYAQRTQTP